MTLDGNGLQIPCHELEKLVCCDLSGDDRHEFWERLARTVEGCTWHNEMDSHKFFKWLKELTKEKRP